jgi:hypothetical protein
MTVTHTDDGTVVTVTAPGGYTLTELRDAAALRFAELRETAVDWPTLVGTRETGPDAFIASYALEV